MSLPLPFLLAFSLLPQLGNAEGFFGATSIKLANGSSKQLRHVHVGDFVASWDDQRHRPAAARVRAVSTYVRDRSDLMEITLPSSTLHVTEDHPFWSHSRQMIVSCRPNSTSDRYGLAAGMMSVGEALEGVKQEGGSFAPWMPVTMHDGSEKQISAVAPGDWVLSWDERSGQTVAAEVAGVDARPGRRLLEVVVEGPERDAAHTHDVRLLLTDDHPVYSARTGGLVSRRPEETMRRYGFHAEPMADLELLHHHLNYSLAARVGDWDGSIPSSVFTLRLHRHHWFFVHGVRVHNKGGWTTVTASTEGRTFFVETILTHSGTRRRYGTYNPGVKSRDGGCTLRPAEEVKGTCNETTGSVFLDGADCDESCCHDCMKCWDMGCVRRIPRCEDFLAEAWEKCEVKPPFPWWGILLVVLAVLSILAALFAPCTCLPRYMIWRAASRRMKLKGCNRRGLTELALKGTYRDGGKTKATSYTLRFTPEGGVSGEGTDADGRFTLVGTLQDEGGADPATICWRESGAAADMEFTGLMEFSGCEINIQGTYVSKLVVDGSLQLARTDSTALPGPEGASTVAKGNVVGVANPPSGP